MVIGRALRFGGLAVLGVVVGAALALVAVIAVIILGLKLFSASESQHAVKEVRSQFDKAAHVVGCRKVVGDPVEPEYRCTVTTPSCTRSYLFAVAHEFNIYSATPASKSNAIFQRPCSIPSDR